MTLTAQRRPRIVLVGRDLEAWKQSIWKRDRGQCALCGRTIRQSYSIHHRQFRSQQGSDVPENGILLCGSGTTGCHGWVHANVHVARLLGFIVSGYANPAEVPMRHALYGVIHLTASGSTRGASLTAADEIERDFTANRSDFTATRRPHNAREPF